MDLPTLIDSCRNGISVPTTQAIVAVESGGQRDAININTDVLVALPSDPVDRAEVAISHGYSVDMGLMQINSQHLDRFGLSVQDAFDPCTNVFVGTSILGENIHAARRQYSDSVSVLAAALSMYNTGTFRAGLDNGYVRAVLSHHPAFETKSNASMVVEWNNKEQSNNEQESNPAASEKGEPGGVGDY